MAQTQSITLSYGKPRNVVATLGPFLASKNHFFIIIGLAGAYLIQLAILFALTSDGLANVKAAKALILAFVLLAVGGFTLINITSLAFWVACRWFGGQGDLYGTRLAVVLMAFCLFLFSSFFLVSFWGFEHEIAPIKVIGYIGMLGSLIYGIAVFLIALCESHRFTIGRASLSLVCGLPLQGMMVYVCIYLFRHIVALKA